MNEGTAKVEQAASQLATLKEELRLKAHLGGMELETLWEEELLPDLETLERHLQRALDKGLREVGEARVRAHLGVLDAKQAWAKLEPRVAQAVDRVRAEAGEAGEALRKLLRTTGSAVEAAAPQEEEERCC